MGYDKDGIGIIGYHMLYYYSFNDKKWRSTKADEDIKYIADKGYIFNSEGITYKLDIHTYTFKPYFINHKDIYDTMIIDDMLYVNIAHDYDVSEDDENHKSINSEYVQLETPNGQYRLSQYQSSKEHRVFKEYKTNQLYNLTEKDCNQLLKEPVREYSISDDGILYSGYEEKAFLYYYDYKTEEVKKLYDESYVNDLELINGYAYFMTVDGSLLNRINLESKERETLKIDDSKLYFDSSEDYIAIASKDDTTINIVDLDRFQITDEIDGSNFKWYNNMLYYHCNGYLCSYDPIEKQTMIMSNITYPSIKTIHNNNLYYLASYDGPSAFGAIPIDESYEFEDDSKTIDYYLIYNENHYYSHLLLYDNNTKRLKSLVNAEKITYEIKGNTIRFKGDSYNNESKWQEVKVERGANIIIQDNARN